MTKKADETSNHRKHKRLTILTLRYKVVSGWDKKKASKVVLGVVKNISEDGLCLRTNSLEIDGLNITYDDTPLVRNKLIIELDLPDMTEPLKLEGEVEWYEKESKRDFYSVGVSFSRIGDEEKNVLKKFIEKVGKYA